MPGGRGIPLRSKEPCESGVIGTPHRERVCIRVDPSGDGISAVAAEERARDRGDGVLIKRIAIGVERTRHNVDSLHPGTSTELNGALDGDCAGGGDLLAREGPGAGRSDGIDAVQRSDIVIAELAGVGDADPARGSANAAHGMHDRPAEHAIRLPAIVQGSGIHLGVVEAENAAEGAFQLVLHHLNEVSVGGAEAVEKDDGMGDGRVGLDVVEPRKDAVVLATGWVAGACSEERVDHRPVGVVDDGERIADCGGCDVRGLREDLVACDHICAVHVFIQLSRIVQNYTRGGYGAPEGGGSVNHRGRLQIADLAVERALVDVVADDAARPVHRLTDNRGIEVGGAGYELGPSSNGHCRYENGKQAEDGRSRRVHWKNSVQALASRAPAFAGKD